MCRFAISIEDFINYPLHLPYSLKPDLPLISSVNLNYPNSIPLLCTFPDRVHLLKLLPNLQTQNQFSVNKPLFSGSHEFNAERGPLSLNHILLIVPGTSKKWVPMTQYLRRAVCDSGVLGVPDPIPFRRDQSCEP